ncbi:NAD(P)/FAD-dependent oxidoreductase [Nitrosococcus oceani]|uniref:Oxidoreductase n=2 Tax=Nitrosococcus oceani TaxID=1229 RepID=Q3J9M8_NITOC|nr:FAD/NAD(P)-binding oxidoreductase [Nitrosococcus oceani]KFI19071.1 pyridine nucleotide-disulfide oxidoreductase [Nitrosococcus oceani C-27]ABA58468.1 putative oxidoreductase [Nitrosococcus oceani ATCC 19707]EDZ67774.1 Pyridine nucleotide-disulphide oxidoreductase, putative [Nitrosococcus oceani AFC27]KFI22349.1 pyridine nucleotide-disulfide oxidoreductase [Nitrosococcus oceani]GEM18863.1 pyridine nucleotide-disulfide oxidoreductase [Nitrosococcus oceani]
MAQTHHRLLIVGGGAAGISVAANMRRKDKAMDIAIIEPSEVHYYQPAFTLVGGGVYDFDKTKRQEQDLIPKEVEWIRDYAESFQPESNSVTLRSGSSVSYDYLVVCPGIQLDWQKIEGLKETLGKNGVSSNYSPHTASYTWECLRDFQGGTALFTQPPMPIKCAGAPQKVMYLAAERFRQRKVLDKANLEFCNAGPTMFGVPFFAEALDKVVAGYGIKANFGCNLVAIDGPGHTATFETTGADGSKERINKSFDFIHVTPPQSAPDFIKNSPLANAAGWVELDENTLQHPRFSNIFGLGDAGSTSNAKTAAAVRKQVPVVVQNILALINDKALEPKYDGYGSCPLTTSLHRVMLAEFSYGGKVTPSFPILDPRSNRLIWWWLKKYGLPPLYWDYMLKGYDWDIPHKASYAEKLVAATA